MEHLTAAVRQAVAQANWYAALGLALALPDICGQLENPQLGSLARYVAWCDRYLVPRYTSQRGHVFLSGRDCYALRCAFLHEGSDEITTQSARDALQSFSFTWPAGGSVHRNQANDQLQLEVNEFCDDVCIGVDQWSVDVQLVADVQIRIGSMLAIRPSADWVG